VRPLPGMSIIGENIRTIRKNLGLTQDAMADKLGIKRSLLGAYEEGRATPKLDVLNVYSDLSGIGIAELVNRLAQTEAARDRKPQRGRPRKRHPLKEE
jgi:transcriptional regulator with XRE-family HTH domain